jgi:hypothetical protein
LIEVNKLSINDPEHWPRLEQKVIGAVFYKLFFHDPSLPVLVTFGSMGMIVTKENANDPNFSPWGFDFAVKLGVNVLSFSSFVQSTWYRCPIFHEWLENNKTLLSVFPERLGYGGSMGGYGASTFSNVLSIDRLLLLNPISTLQKEIVPWETRPFENAADLNDWTGKFADGAETKSNGWVVFDPIFHLDSLHAKRFCGLKKITFPGVGHQIPKHLNHFGLLKPLIIDFISDVFQSSDFYKEIRNRRNYINYYKWLESDQNTHKTSRRLVIIGKYKNQLIKRNTEGKHNETGIVDEILSLALEIENHDLTAYNVLEKIAKNVQTLGLHAQTKADVDFIKVTALKFEKDWLSLALKLMKLALLLRPNGPFLAKKVKEYESKLAEPINNVKNIS